MRRKARKDSNHVSVIGVLRLVGLSVLDISTVPNCCDLVVSNGERTILVEVKNPEYKKATKVDMLTEGELKFRESWRGEYLIVYYPEEVIEYFNKFRE